MSRIELQTLTPSVYYSQSRDFQFVGRLFDIVLNSVKTNAEMLYNLPISDNSDSKLTDLMALTLGLKLKHKYPAKQLTAICSCFSEILRNKGSLYAIELTIEAMLNAEGITESYRCDISSDNKAVNIYVPYQLSDVTLLRDILDYILPAGMSCNIGIMNFDSDSRTTKVNVGADKRYRHDAIHYELATDVSSTPNIYGQQGGYLGATEIYKGE